MTNTEIANRTPFRLFGLEPKQLLKQLKAKPDIDVFDAILIEYLTDIIEEEDADK